MTKETELAQVLMNINASITNINKELAELKSAPRTTPKNTDQPAASVARSFKVVDYASGAHGATFSISPSYLGKMVFRTLVFDAGWTCKDGQWNAGSTSLKDAQSTIDKASDKAHQFAISHPRK